MPRAGLNRQAVIEAALAIIDEGGADAFRDLTLASVAGRAGVAGPSLYKHIGSLDDLRRELAVASVRSLTGALSEAAIGRAGAEAVVALARTVRDFAERHPARYSAAQQAGDPNHPEDAELIAAGADSVAVIRTSLRGYDLTPEQEIDAIRAFRSAVHGFVMLELGGGFGLTRTLDDSFEALTTMLTSGLAGLANPGG